MVSAAAAWLGSMKANTEIATSSKKMDFTFFLMNHPPFEQL
jgi:hypothetical protein